MKAHRTHNTQPGNIQPPTCPGPTCPLHTPTNGAANGNGAHQPEIKEAVPEIEHGIPTPIEPKFYPSKLLQKMQVGDSVLLTQSQASSMKTTAWRMDCEIIQQTLVRVWKLSETQ